MGVFVIQRITSVLFIGVKIVQGVRYIEQWQTTDKSTLITQTVTFEEYNELLINLVTDQCIILGDFAENYKYVIQDEILPNQC